MESGEPVAVAAHRRGEERRGSECAHELGDDVLDDLAKRGLHAVASKRRVYVGGELRDHLRVRLALELEAAPLLRAHSTAQHTHMG